MARPVPPWFQYLLVRLKDRNTPQDEGGGDKFQYLLVRLKARTGQGTTDWFLFQYLLVRLKAFIRNKSQSSFLMT